MTLLHKYDRIMNKEDAEAAELIQRVFQKEGISLILNAKPLQVAKTATGKLVQYESDGQQAEIEVDEILIGAGRAPNVEGLNLEAAGVKYEAGKGRGVLVNDRLQTTNPQYLRGRRHLPALPVYPSGRLRGPHRHPERPVLRPQEAERPDHSLVHLHRPGSGPRGPE